MPLTLKREASDASLPQQSPRKKTLKSSFSRANLKASKSIFGLRQKPVSESVPSADDAVQSRKRSLFGSIRSKAGSALQSKRAKHRHDGSDNTETSGRKTSGSVHSRLLPHWDLSFFSRSQPIRIPAGRIEDSQTTACDSQTHEPDTHLQLRLQNEIDLGGSLTFGDPPFTQTIADSGHRGFRAPRSSSGSGATANPDASQLGSTPCVGLWQPRVRNRGSEQTSSSYTTSTSPPVTEVDDMLVAKFEGLWEKGYSNCAESQCLRSLDEIIRNPDVVPTYLPASKSDNRGEVEQGAESKHFLAQRTGQSDACLSADASANGKSAHGTLQSLRTRSNSHVRFATDRKGSARQMRTDADMSPTLPAVNINNPRARQFAPSVTRPPTPGVDCVELENTIIGCDADTFKELRIRSSLQSSENAIENTPASELLELPVESTARKSLDRMVDPRRNQRSSTSSDSIATEFTEVKDGGVKSVKSIVMDGLRGPMSGHGSARWRFSSKNSARRDANEDE